MKYLIFSVVAGLMVSNIQCSDHESATSCTPKPVQQKDLEYSYVDKAQIEAFGRFSQQTAEKKQNNGHAKIEIAFNNETVSDNDVKLRTEGHKISGAQSTGSAVGRIDW